MICIQTIKKFCKEDPSMIENYDKAIADNTQTWHCHHRDEIRTLPSGIKVYRSKQELIENGRYYNCPANELIFLTNAEHIKLHNMEREFHKEPTTEFGRKFKEHYGISDSDNHSLYAREHYWYRKHNNKCRWEEL